MTKGKHTQGEWTVAPNGAQLRIWGNAGSTRFGVADICINRSIDNAGKPSAEEEANARLIAAAPDGLALAYAVAAHFEGTDAPLGKQARDFISKATGEQS